MCIDGRLSAERAAAKLPAVSVSDRDYPTTSEIDRNRRYVAALGKMALTTDPSQKSERGRYGINRPSSFPHRAERWSFPCRNPGSARSQGCRRTAYPAGSQIAAGRLLPHR
jgi:hypothetical protein